tara:strand:- start:1557 stop:2039 length:483 start_codon:yes stop_codon:yes gene_type:complete
LIPFRSIITTDKVFILLLVILLPLTGCLDATDNADAENPSSEPDAENPSSEPVAVTTPDVYSLRLLADNMTTITLDGNSTLKVETIFRTHDANISYPETSVSDITSSFDMICNGTTIVTAGDFTEDEYLPVLGGQLCTLEIVTTQWDYIVIFSSHSLASL